MLSLKERETDQIEVGLYNVTKIYHNDVKALKDLSLEIKKGEFFSLLGPSGCGKTTLLRLIAGLEKPCSGIITLAGSTVAGTSWVPPEKRGVGLVFQDYALFPHLTVYNNIAFGLSGLSKEKSKEKVRDILELIGLPDIGQRYPHELSGGQQQRVSLGRALAPGPRIILLDEPFSNLDADLREELRLETKKILKMTATTTIMVTHDQHEAFALSDRIGVLNQGLLEQVGSPYEIYHKPASRFIANFVEKAYFLSARMENNQLTSILGTFPYVKGISLDSGHVEIMLRPDDVEFTLDPQGSAIITEIIFLGTETIYKIRLKDGSVVSSINYSKSIKEKIEIGNRVTVQIEPSHLVIFPLEQKAG